MAKKKKTAVKAEVMASEGVNLDTTARLDFSLNKNDVIEYYLAEAEEKLEQDIKSTVDQISKLHDEAEQLKTDFENVIKKRFLKDHKAVISGAKRALSKLYALGFGASYHHDPSRNLDVTVQLRDSCVRVENTRLNLWTHKYYQSNPGKNLPADVWGREQTCLFSESSRDYRLSPTKKDGADISRATIVIGSVSSGLIDVEWDDKLAKLAKDHVDKLNKRIDLIHDLHALVKQHDSLPQLKRSIKKQVVGRVLKNTDEGKLMLKALKGLKTLDATKVLTDNGK